MYGLEAINNAHGWAMAITGALIVMSGLAFLAFIISQFPKAVALIEKTETSNQASFQAPEAPAVSPQPEFTLDPGELVKKFKPLAEDLGPEFELAQLYTKAREQNLPHVHLTIRTLRDSGKLVALGDGKFTWNE